MKKIILIACCALFAANIASAQQGEKNPLLTKNGYKYLPVEGDFALGIDATPILGFIGNTMNGSSDNSANNGFNGVSQTIYGKYFIADDRAIRAKLRFNVYSESFKGTVANQGEILNNPLNYFASSFDVKKVNTTNVDLIVGYEYRRGHGRVQGIYGGEVGLGFGDRLNRNGNVKYNYANAMTELNKNPETSDFRGGIFNASYRPTEVKSGKEFRASVAGFIGVEYFVAPQISLGGEFNVGVVYANKSQDKVTTQEFMSSTGRVETRSFRYRDDSDVANLVGFKTTTQASLNLMFYF